MAYPFENKIINPNIRTLSLFQIEKMEDLYLQVRFKYQRVVWNAYEVVNDVETSRVDFGFTGLTSLPGNCEFEELFVSRPLLVTRRDNDYCLPAHPGLEDLERLCSAAMARYRAASSPPSWGETLRK